MHPPKNQRTVLVVVGFAYDTESNVICENVHQKIRGQEVFPRIKAAVAHLGPPEGRRRVSPAIKALRIRAVERGFLTNGAKTDIDEDWEHGRVWFKKLRTEGRAITIYGRWCIQEN